MNGDGNGIERRIAAAQLGLLAGLLIVVAGPETADLATGVGAQLLIVLASVLGALLIEHRTRSPRYGAIGR